MSQSILQFAQEHWDILCTAILFVGIVQIGLVRKMMQDRQAVQRCIKARSLVDHVLEEYNPP